jgi:membrane-bound lytic murein transglycosylase D
MLTKLKLGLIACASLLISSASANQISRSPDFHEPECLSSRVDFWEAVYTKYDRDKALVLQEKDMKILEVINWPESKKHRKTIVRNIKNKYKNTEIKIQQGIKSKFEEGLNRYNNGLGEVVHNEFKKAGLPPELALLAHVESSYNSKAVSKAKAKGLFQIMPFWVKPLGLKSHKQLKYPDVSARAAVKLFALKHEEVRHWPLTVTAWNQGIGAMVDAQDKLGNDICRVVNEYKGKRYKYAGRNFFAALLAVIRIVEKTESPTWQKYAPQKETSNDTMP